MFANCNPLTYPLLFQREDMRWHCNLQTLLEYSKLICHNVAIRNEFREATSVAMTF